MIDKSDNITNLASALLKAQRVINAAIKNEKNPYFKSNYADLQAVIDAVKEPLNSNGICFLQAVNTTNSELPVIETILLHESGQYMCSVSPVFCAKPNDPQAFGSGVTYSKRYALQALLGLPTADDDGEGAMARGKLKTPTPPNKPIDKVITDGCSRYMDKYCNEIPEGFSISPTKLKDELRKAFKKECPTKTKADKFVWDDKNVDKLFLTVKLEDTLEEIKGE